MKLIKFACVGSVGFIVDSAIFMLCIQMFDISIFLSRIIAFFFAATTTWSGNHWFTFYSVNNNIVSLFKEWQRSMLSACVSAVPNFIVFIGLTSFFGEHIPMVYICLCLGVIVGVFSNYWLSRRWVFNEIK